MAALRQASVATNGGRQSRESSRILIRRRDDGSPDIARITEILPLLKTEASSGEIERLGVDPILFDGTRDKVLAAADEVGKML